MNILSTSKFEIIVLIVTEVIYPYLIKNDGIIKK